MTELDLNMGYYTIILYPGSQGMRTIVTEFGKFRYNKLPMGMCTSRYISQVRVGELLDNIEGVENYIDYILVFNKDCFRNHVEQLIMILGRLCVVGLKVNSPKCNFGLKENSYLGHVITRESIKPDPRKVQGIMGLGQSATTTEAQAHI